MPVSLVPPALYDGVNVEEKEHILIFGTHSSIWWGFGISREASRSYVFALLAEVRAAQWEKHQFCPQSCSQCSFAVAGILPFLLAVGLLSTSGNGSGIGNWERETQ